jgi:PRTRC genetic system protein C
LNPSLTVDQIKDHYTQFFPELNNADTTHGKRGDNEEITFTRRTGTKGQEKADSPKWEMRQIKPEDLSGFENLRPFGIFQDGQLMQTYTDKAVAAERCRDAALYLEIREQLSQLANQVMAKFPGATEYSVFTMIFDLLREELY